MFNPAELELATISLDGRDLVKFQAIKNFFGG